MAVLKLYIILLRLPRRERRESTAGVTQAGCGPKIHRLPGAGICGSVNLISRQATLSRDSHDALSFSSSSSPAISFALIVNRDFSRPADHSKKREVCSPRDGFRCSLFFLFSTKVIIVVGRSQRSSNFRSSAEERNLSLLT